MNERFEQYKRKHSNIQTLIGKMIRQGYLITRTLPDGTKQYRITARGKKRLTAALIASSLGKVKGKEKQ